MRALRLIFVFHYFLLGGSFVFSQNSEDSNNQEFSEEEGDYSAGSEGGLWNLKLPQVILK